ncbi:MAG: diguanylate cyclase domain-containing protein [Rhizobiaceae bacterium]
MAVELRMFREPGNFKGKPLSRLGWGKPPRKGESDRRQGAGDDVGTIKRLEARIRKQARLIAAQREALAYSRKIFDRASAAASIGVWQCSLPDETLRWTDVVYDMFDLPRGSALDRDEIVKLYSEESARELGKRRSKAIAERAGFNLDAEIITAKGNRRWIRITATVECEGDVPIRIFGMKQDITEEKLLADQTRYLAEFDVMTGLANRSQFQDRLADLENGGSPRQFGALLLVDLDDFKAINDTFGHIAGDQCLKEAATRLKLVYGGAHFVARIGGDEFAILLAAHLDRTAIVHLARATVRAMVQPADVQGRLLEFGASVGGALLADCSPSDLFSRADAALYAAKAAGRNTYSLFEPEALPARTAQVA